MVYKYLLKTYIERHKHIKNKSYFKYKKINPVPIPLHTLRWQLPRH